MFQFFYSLPLLYVIISIILLDMFWAILYFIVLNKEHKFSSRARVHFNVFNTVIMVFIIYVIIDSTPLQRSSYIDKLILTPFYSFAVAQIQPEMYRSLLMNIALFVPFGCSFSCVLSKKMSYCTRIMITSLLGCVLSLLIEFLQYFFKLGEAWTDDVVCNALGAFIGSLSIVIWKIYYIGRNEFY